MLERVLYVVRGYLMKPAAIRIVRCFGCGLLATVERIVDGPSAAATNEGMLKKLRAAGRREVSRVLVDASRLPALEGRQVGPRPVD
jgi:hypothetical protein